ncbi:MAG: YerC/YecD family TrpR-related protein [Acutalibacteraceae bacterium]|nr:YerC/YecD family TrpR-related protein [Acutalibacteraceae bacterium]
MHKLDKERMSLLYKAVLSLKTEEECAAFFEDACTVQETEAIAQRIEVACQLNCGKSYVDINKSTGASTATICRVSRCLNYGSGGYKTVIGRLEENK